MFPVASGEQIDLVVTFVHALGDLDAAILDATGTVIDSQAGFADTEVLTWANAEADPAPLVLRVYGYAGAENTYDIMVTRQ